LNTPARRLWLVRVGGLACSLAVTPAGATRDGMLAQIARFTGGASPRSGKVEMTLPEIVENGNSVPVTVTVPSPMTEREHVRRIAVFTEKNPHPGVIEVFLGPTAGRAQVSFRMRMADSQQVSAVAELSDGSFWIATLDVVVALAACLE
jgi:sulfur-oxidizing protein SoxY